MRVRLPSCDTLSHVDELVSHWSFAERRYPVKIKVDIHGGSCIIDSMVSGVDRYLPSPFSQCYGDFKGKHCKSC